MTRLSASIAALLAAASAAIAGFEGFPIETNTNAPSWYLAQDLHAPLVQLWNAINERCIAAGQPLLGIVETHTIDDVWLSTNMYVSGFWYWSWDGPDAEGLWQIGYEGAYPTNLVWVLPQMVDGDDVYYGGILVSNRWQSTVTVVTTNHFGAIECGSVTGFPFVSRALLTAMESKLDALSPYYKFPGTNTTWGAHWASTDSRQSVSVGSGLSYYAPRIPEHSVAGLWAQDDLGFVTNIATNAWGEITGGTYHWDSGAASTDETAVAGWDTNRSPYRLYAYELDRIYHVVTNLRWTVRSSRKGVDSSVFSSGTGMYAYGQAATHRTNDWSVADAEAVASYEAFESFSPVYYPKAYSERRVARNHSYSAYNPEANSYDISFARTMLETATLSNVCTNRAADIYFYLGDYSATYTNDVVWGGYDASVTSGSGDWINQSDDFYPYWTTPNPSSIPWAGNGDLTNILSMELVYQVAANTNTSVSIPVVGSTNLPAYAETPVLPMASNGMNYQRRGYESTDWIVIFDWQFQYR